ncbi:MAG: hypothetical protein ACFFD7_10330 [Candidatus Thorarchaeota archaeon]
MKKQKVIGLKDPKLKAIRLNLRKLWNSAYYDEEAALQVVWLSSSGDTQISLLRELEEFRQIYRDSIIVCGICGKLDGDRVYVPRHKRWYCKDCFSRGFKKKN